jgi:hypothetical protein
MNEIATQTQASVMERVMIEGDLSKLNAQDRIQYYGKVCESLGLNPLTKPFDYIQLNGKLTLYCKRDATEQLRKIHKVSIQIISREKVDDLYIVTARAVDASGRSDESVGAVTLKNLSGDNLANAIMKAETKAKRRATLSIVGLGWLDETEVSSIPDAKPVQVTEEGEIIEAETVDLTVLENAKEYVLTFGKHNGQKLSDVVKSDHGWVNWYAEHGDKEDVLTAIKTLMKAYADYKLRKQQEHPEGYGDPVPDEDPGYHLDPDEDPFAVISEQATS